MRFIKAIALFHHYRWKYYISCLEYLFEFQTRISLLLNMICKKRSLGWTKEARGSSIKTLAVILRKILSYLLNDLEEWFPKPKLNPMFSFRLSLYWFNSNSRRTGQAKQLGSKAHIWELAVLCLSCTHTAFRLWKNSCCGGGSLMQSLDSLLLISKSDGSKTQQEFVALKPSFNSSNNALLEHQNKFTSLPLLCQQSLWLTG